MNIILTEEEYESLKQRLEEYEALTKSMALTLERLEKEISNAKLAPCPEGYAYNPETGYCEKGY